MSGDGADVPGNGCAIRLILHGAGAPLLRLGFGPGPRPLDAVGQIRRLFDAETSWARGRSPAELQRMLGGSQAAVSAWLGTDLVGFGRATSDGTFRAVLWDVVVAERQAGRGLGRRLVETLLTAPPVARAERVYLMTTHGTGFYVRLGFERITSQDLMLRKRSG